MSEKNISGQDTQNEKPPIFKSWKRLYTFVVVQLVVLILLFYIFTKAFE